MAVTIVTVEKLLNDQSTIGEDGFGSETQTYLVEVQEEDATPLEVRRKAHASIPAYDSEHPLDEKLKVTSKTAKRASSSNGKPSKYHWQIDVTYSVPKKSNGGGGSDTENSTNVHVAVNGVEQSVYTQVGYDSGGEPMVIRNAVGDLYPDPQEVIIYDEQITITFEKDEIDGNGIAAMRGKINDAAVSLNIPQGNSTYSRSFATNTLLLASCDYDIVISREVSGDDEIETSRWGIRVVLLYRADTWIRKLPEKGYRWYDGGVKTEWKDHAEYLTGSGDKLGVGASLVTFDAQLEKEADLTTFLQGI